MKTRFTMADLPYLVQMVENVGINRPIPKRGPSVTRHLVHRRTYALDGTPRGHVVELPFQQHYASDRRYAERKLRRMIKRQGSLRL